MPDQPGRRPAFPEPTAPAPDRAAVLLRYLDHLRETSIGKVADLDEQAARASALPSGWSPLELLWHLAHVERRWLVWGFEGTDVGDPWADARDGRWHVPDGLRVADVVEALRAQGRARAARREHRRVAATGAGVG